ncbi:MAG: YwqG family protein [Treponema sp.]|nr:YwqG family protein [Treponema sp.]
MSGLLKKLFGFGKSQQQANEGAATTAPSSASNKTKEQEGFFTLEQQQLLVAQIQKQTQREAIRIHATKAVSPQALTTSKFGGLPYWNPAEPYPSDGAGNPCVLLAQFDCQQLPSLEGFPKTGLLQFFVSSDGSYGLDFDNQMSQENWRVVYHPVVDSSISESVVTELGIPTTSSENDLDLPFTGEFHLEFELVDTWLGPCSHDDFQQELQKAIVATGLSQPPEGTSLYDIFCEDIYNQMADWNEGHWLGGYPCFTQDDPRFSRSDYAACTNLLFQMDSGGEANAEILWGDTGVGNFLIAPEDLQQLDFSRVLYNWDCL